MHVRRLFIRLSLLIAGIIVLSCERRPIDFRNKYRGSYTFTSHTVHWTVSSGSSSSDEIFTGWVDYYTIDDRDKIRIKFSESREPQYMAILKDGTLSECGTDCGKFESSDRVSFTLRNCSGLGGGFSIKVTGTREQ